MDYVIVNWQEILSLAIVAAAAVLLIKSESGKYRRKKLGLCGHDSDCAVAKLKSTAK